MDPDLRHWEQRVRLESTPQGIYVNAILGGWFIQYLSAASFWVEKTSMIYT